ncbi:MAG: hypothetical protein KF902_11755 [Phycisphaeraceae bacterium]|nr:hypothetical protein [Phycisphaeraceae bacterium]MCW5769832.1 hypothetical protein [Phycisphaeraceae bacterium]
MKVQLMIVVAAVVLIALVSRMVTYSLRFTEVAVVTTFGEAGENSTITSPGLHFKAPYPIQSVTKYDTRVRFMQTRSETQQTADDRQIVVEAFVTWRVRDPLAFFQRFSNAGEREADHYRRAEEILRSALRSGLSETSRYRMDELFTSEGRSKLPELEARVLATMTGTGTGGQSLASAGILVEAVGVNRVVLPEETTTAVFDRMAADRDRLVKEIEAQGFSSAEAIRSSARAQAETIRAFASARAEEIRTQGDIEGARFLGMMSANPELATFLRNMEFMATVMSRRITLVFPTTMPGFDVFRPDLFNGLKRGEIPTSGFSPEWLRTQVEDRASEPVSSADDASAGEPR